MRSVSSSTAVMRAWVEALDVSNETLEAVTGLASGFCRKLLSGNPCRRMGVMSRALLLDALALKVERRGGGLAVYVDEEAFARVRPLLVRRRRNGRRRGFAV
jgi:hypothetical protein